MNDNTDVAAPKSTGGLVCAILGGIFIGTFYLSFLAFPFCLAAWILGARAVSRARRLEIGAGGSAISAKVMGTIGTISSGVIVICVFLVPVLVPAVSSGMRQANQMRFQLNGRQLHQQIVHAGLKSPGLDAWAIWPRSAETKDDDGDGISGRVFGSSTDYFAELLDVAHAGTPEWSPYVNQISVQEIYGGRKDGQTAGRLDPQRVMWSIAEGVTDDLPDSVPVLVSANLDCGGLLSRYEGGASGRLASLDGKSVVIVRKGGEVETIEPEDLTLARVYGGQTFDDGPKTYLTPFGRVRTR